MGDVLTARMLAYDVGGMIDHQIMRDGTLPLELERPRKIHYTCYAMTAFFRCVGELQCASIFFETMHIVLKARIVMLTFMR